MFNSFVVRNSVGLRNGKLNDVMIIEILRRNVVLLLENFGGNFGGERNGEVVWGFIFLLIVFVNDI